MWFLLHHPRLFVMYAFSSLQLSYQISLLRQSLQSLKYKIWWEVAMWSFQFAWKVLFWLMHSFQGWWFMFGLWALKETKFHISIVLIHLPFYILLWWRMLIIWPDNTSSPILFQLWTRIISWSYISYGETSNSFADLCVWKSCFNRFASFMYLCTEDPKLFPCLVTQYLVWKTWFSFVISLNVGAKERQEIYDAFENIYPILKSFRKSW